MLIIIGLSIILLLFFTALANIRWFIYSLLLLGVMPLQALTGGEKNLFMSLGGINISGIRLFVAVLLMILYVLTNKKALKYIQKYKVYFLFLTFVFFSLLYSSSKMDGLRFLFKLVYPFLIFIIVLVITRNKKHVHRMVKVILVSGILATVFVLVNIFKGTAFVMVGGAPRLTGAIGRNVHCYYMGILSLLCYTVYCHLGKKRSLYLFLFLVFFSQAILTLSRIGIFSLVVAFLLTECLQKNVRKILLISMIFLIALFPLRHQLADRFFRGSQVESGNLLSIILSMDTQGRDRLWKPVIDNISTNNIIQGHGVGSTYTLTREVKFVIADSATLKPELHNDWLRFLYEIGILGLLLFIFFCAALIRGFSRIIKFGNLKKIPQISILSLVAIGCVTHFLLTMTVDNSFNNYDMYSGFVWTIAALAIKSYQIYSEQLYEKPKC